MTSEQELLEQRLASMEEFMAKMNGVLETLVQNQSRSPLLTSKEQTDMLRARFQAEQREAATGVAAGGTTEANPEAEAGGSGAPVQNPSSRRTTTVRELAAHTEGVRSLVVRAEGSRPIADVAERLAHTEGARSLRAQA